MPRVVVTLYYFVSQSYVIKSIFQNNNRLKLMAYFNTLAFRRKESGILSNSRFGIIIIPITNL